MADKDHYFRRGVSPVATNSSLLVSSSKYLNDPRLRDWVATICLRKNGPDFPAPAELVDLIEILDGLRDLDRLEALFTAERQVNPALDAWFREAYIPPPTTIADYKQYPPGTLGGIFHERMAGRYEVQFLKDQWEPASSQYEYYWRREIHNHDLEHILLGAGIDPMGELVPSWFRMTNLPKHLQSRELVSELLTYKIFASLRYMVRTILHYPHSWVHCVDAVHRGMVAGWASEPLFMKKMEPVLGLPLAEARAALGVRGAVDRDTGAAGIYWEGAAEPPAPLEATEIISSMLAALTSGAGR